MRYVRKRSYFSLLLACRTIRRIRRKLLWVPSLVFFCCPFHGLLFLSLCQRYCEQVRLVHLTVLAVPVPQIREQIVDVIKVILEEWMSQRIVQQIVDVPVPQILEEIVAIVAGEVVCRRQATARVDVHLSGSRSWMVRYHRSRRRLLK